jgi:hypothetical protein
MVVANDAHGHTDTDPPRAGVATHVGCSVAGALVTVGFVGLVGAGTVFAALSALEYLSTTLFVWLVLVWWVVWWLAAELVVGRVRGRRAGGPNTT